MSTSVPVEPITVMPMPPVPTHLVASYVLATQASVVMESAVQVTKFPLFSIRVFSKSYVRYKINATQMRFAKFSLQNIVDQIMRITTGTW